MQDESLFYNRCASPFCESGGLDYESVKDFFLFCPRYAAKINFFLFGVKSLNYDINCTLFREVRTFIINTNRFSVATV